MNNWLPFLIWIFSQVMAVLALFGSQPAWNRLLLFVTGHAIASACLSLLLTTALPRRVNDRRWSLALFFSFSFFIPILGSLGMLAALVYFRFFQRFEGRTEFSSVPMSPFMSESGTPATGMGEGGAWSRLRATQLPRQVRLKAIMAASSGGGPNTTRLLQLATSDSDDEIRLLAFNLSDRLEKLISSAISESLKALRATATEADRAPLCRKLAFSYWEMIFNDLATEELAAFFARQSLFYARQSFEITPIDAPLLVLMGRLHLWQGDVPSAEIAITNALEQGAPRDRVVPYLAEIAYRKRDYLSLKRYFETDPLLRHKPGIGQVAKFWMDIQ